MRLGQYLMRRIAFSILVLVGLSIVIFIIARVVPGDPTRMALGARAPQWAVDKLKAEMNLDKPLQVQYVYWLKGALRGDFGTSLVTRRPVVEDVKEFLPATVELVIFAGLIQSLFGILLGILAAMYSNTWVDGLIRLLAYLGVVTPAFVFAVLFLLLFGYSWQVLPTAGRLSNGIAAPPLITGMVTVDSLITGHLTAFWDSLKHLLLPGLALAMGGLSQEARITRSAMSDNLNKDYIALETSQGIPRRVIISKYLLKPSLIPTVSIMGLDFASLFGNAFLVELIFNWPGFSRYGITTMLRKDLNAISAVILVLGLVFIVVNMATDIIVSYLDPRIRLGAGKDA
ncbi:MAG: ABC transporter permease [Firmicutes bacterium]|nr:ABC transporter permease [Bacillota bacterium]